jgi:hypothetical protein
MLFVAWIGPEPHSNDTWPFAEHSLAHPFPEDESVINSCLEQKLMTVFTKPTAQSFDGLVVFRGKISTTNSD